jgi:membrane protein DedA with SNARE-associated domain
VEELLEGLPFWAVLAVLWSGAFARGTALYWLGRGARAGGARSRWAHHLDRPLVVRAESWVRRIGPPAVTLGYLTVGVQSAINASAGILRMPLRRFLPAVALGALLWAVLYATVGLAVVDAWLGNLSWWWAVAAVGVLVAVVLVSRRLERPVTGPAEQSPADDHA